MRIYNASNQLILDVEVDDKSYRRREIMGENALYLYFSLSYYIDVEVGAYTDCDGERYYLLEPNNFKKHHSRNFEYSIVMEPSQALLRDAKFKYFTMQGEEYSDFEVKFSLVFTPVRFAELLVANMNLTDSGWAVGDCIEAPEQLIDFSADSCEQALIKIAEAFRTEFEVDGKTIHIRKVEKDKTSAVALSYGKNKGFLPGLGRSNYDGSKLVNRIYVNASERNIDSSVYGHTTLRMPKNRAFTYEGVDYITDPSGTWLEVANRVGRCIEETIDLTNIYPSRVGTVTSVVAIDNSKALYDFTDTSIPETLNFTETVIPSETLSVIFQTGNLAGYEFDVEYIHASRLFRIIPITENGASLPKSPLIPAVGDEYAVFHTQLPEQYVTDASEQLLAEAVKQLHELKQPKFTFTGTLDEVFAHNNWLEVGGKLNPGNYVSFSDGQFLTAAELIRIVAVKEFVNKPKALVIDLSNEVSGKALTAVLNELKGYDQAIVQAKKEAMSYSKRLWQVTQELLDAIYDPDGSFQTELTSSTALLSLMARIGTQSLQFRFRDITTGAVIVPNFAFASGVFSVPLCMLDHMTMGITAIKPSLNESDRKQWRMNAYASPSLESNKKYYLYAKCSVANVYGTGGAFIGDGVFVLSETEIQLEQVPNYYHFWVGFLHTEYEGERTFSPMYGYSEILPGQITTNRLQSDDAQTVIDLVQGIIEGKFIFKSGSSGYANLADKPDLSVYSEKTYVDSLATSLQSQIDGVVDSWFYAYSPTLANYPANEWTTNTVKDRHIGDTFTNTQEFVDNSTTPDAGKSWRFVKNGSVYSWSPIADSDAVKALLAAAQAQDTADGKRRTFTTQPTNADAYAVGDLWVNATYSTTYSNDILKCKTAKAAGAAFSISHWEKAGKYTDDTAANAAAAAASAAQTAANNAQTAANTANTAISNITSDNILSAAEKPSQRLEWNTISAEKAGINAQAAAFSVTAENTAYNNAFQALANYLNNGTTWSSGVPTWLADANLGSNTTIVGATYRTNWQNFYAARTTLLNAIAAKAKALADAAQSSIDNLEIGGVNLIPISSSELSEPISLPQYFATYLSINENSFNWVDAKFNVGTKLILSAYIIAGNKDVKLRVNAYKALDTNYIILGLSDETIQANSEGWARVVVTLTNSEYPRVACCIGNADTTIGGVTTNYLRYVKLEKGTKQTSWSPAPSQVQAQLDNITLDSKFSPSEKQSIRVEWERIFQEKAALVTTGTALGLTLEVSDINSAFQALATYLNGSTTWSSGTPLWISDAQLNVVTDIDAATFRSKFQYYYNAAIALRREIDAEMDVNITSVENDVASLNYLKQALTGSTEVQGGLVGTNVLLLKTLAGIVTGGFSGLASDNVGFWTGGEYQDAIDSLAKVLFRKDGSGQLAGGKILWDLLGNLTVGNIFIDNAGSAIIKDSGGVNRVLLTRNEIITLASIASSTQNTTVNNSASLNTSVGQTAVDLANSITANNNNSNVNVQCTLSSSITTDISGTGEGSASVKLYLRNLSTYEEILVSSLSLYRSTVDVQKQVVVDENVVVAAGTYKLRIVYTHTNYFGCVFQSSVSASTAVVTFDGSTQTTHIGRNGLGVIGNANNYLFAGIENGVFKVVEKSTGVHDRPGVLAAGSVSTIGGTDKSWGAKVGSSSKLATGSYRVNHSVGHTDYFVQITPRANVRLAYISATYSTYFTVVLTNTSGTNTDTAFDYQIVGNNQ